MLIWIFVLLVDLLALVVGGRGGVDRAGGGGLSIDTRGGGGADLPWAGEPDGYAVVRLFCWAVLRFSLW